MALLNSDDNKSFLDNEGFRYMMYNSLNKALVENKEYQDLQEEAEKYYNKNNIDSYEEAMSTVQIKGIEIGYIQGWKDAVKMLTSSLN